jgi:hypothetical protein
VIRHDVVAFSNTHATKENVMNEDILIDLGEVSEETKGNDGPENESFQNPDKRP